jgi:hypothetical protein
MDVSLDWLFSPFLFVKRSRFEGEKHRILTTLGVTSEGQKRGGSSLKSAQIIGCSAVLPMSGRRWSLSDQVTV